MVEKGSRLGREEEGVYMLEDALVEAKLYFTAGSQSHNFFGVNLCVNAELEKYSLATSLQGADVIISLA